MRFHTGFMVFAGALLSAVSLCAQTAGDPEVTRAKAEIDRLRGLVEAGAAPRMQLQKAEDALADAEDAAILRRTLYGQDLTEEQADTMIAAAQRRFDRRKKTYDDSAKLVEAGAAAAASLDTPREAMQLARKECDLAESRATLVRAVADMARLEEALAFHPAAGAPGSHAVMERHDGDGIFTTGMFEDIEQSFQQRFGKSLPVSAMGQTAVHTALGFNHRGRVDVAVSPDSPEGEWLRLYLTVKRIPFFAFRQAVPGKATGAHIHIGPMSNHLTAGS